MATKERRCALPGCKNVGVHLCSGCGEEIYCSKECQKSHWTTHKTLCKLATKPEAAAFMQSFDALSVKQLKNMLKVKVSNYETKKRESILNQLEKVTEKPHLINIVKQHVQTSEIDVLLSASPVVPTSTSAGGESTTIVNGVKMRQTTKARNPPKGMMPPGGAGGMGEMSPDMLKMQATMMRKNPDLVRSSNPMFSKMTNQQIAEYATQLEQAAANPDMLKEFQKLSKMSTKDRDQIQSLQEGLMGSKPMDEKWIGNAVKILKTNPDLLKSLFDRKGPGGESLFPGGITSEHIHSFIDGAASFDASTLKFILRTLIWLGSFVKPTMQFYEKADKATYGLVRYAVIALVGMLIYLSARFTMFVMRWVFSLLYMVYLSFMGQASSAASSSSSSSSATTVASPGILQLVKGLFGSLVPSPSPSPSGGFSNVETPGKDEFEF